MKMRRTALRFVVAALLVVGWTGIARAEDKKKQERIVAVVHPANGLAEIAGADMKNIYLGRRKTWSDGTAIRPFMRPHQQAAGYELLKGILQMTPARFKRHWQGLELSGQGTTPKTLASATDVSERIAGLKGGISFVTESEAKGLPTQQVKVIKIKY